MLSLLEVRSIQAAKSKSSSCPRKNASRELWLICQALLVSKFGKRELVLDFYKSVLHQWECGCVRTRRKEPSQACIAIALSGRFIRLVAF